MARIIGPDRIPCVVPGCGRTAKREDRDREIICGPHYRLVPRWMRRRYRRLRRLMERAVSMNQPELIERIYPLCLTTWEKIKARSIEVAMGISA